MKILIIGQLPKEIGGNYSTGAANVVYELGKHKQENIEVYTYGTNIKRKVARAVSQYKNQYIGYSFCPLRMIYHFFCNPQKHLMHLMHYKRVDHQNILRFLFYEFNIKEAIKQVAPDLIHIHSIGNLSPVYFARGKEDIPILLTCHGIFYRGEKDDKIGRDRYLGNIHLADAYSGLTNESVDEFQKILGINKDVVSIIPNGVDCSRFYFDKKERDIYRSKLGVSANTIVFITVASVQERKGQYSFIKILEKLNIGYQYWIIGTGNDLKKIEMYVNQHNLDKKVKLLGYRSANELYRYYSAADIYAHVSTKEGQALCEIEAYATGLKILINERIKGTVSSMDSGDYYVYNPDNPQIKEIETWAVRCDDHRCSRKSLDWQVIAEKYASLYKSILMGK